MGFGDLRMMRAGLLAVKNAKARTVGTITVDSFTRLNQHAAARRAMRSGHGLNGFPLVAHGPALTRSMLDGVQGLDFPVQVRHGSPLPLRLFESQIKAGLDATEGGPVSYCLPYGRTPLAQSVRAWRKACQLLAEQRARGMNCHVESFGGCMLGQLCPPSLLVALSLLEAIFFVGCGIASVSLSYAQQTDRAQDEEAIAALRQLAGLYLADVDWHVVVYTYMGLFPRTPAGAITILKESVRLAVAAGAERLIVKTTAESDRIPTIAENIAALELAARVARESRAEPAIAHRLGTTETLEEASALVERVLDLHADVGTALRIAFQSGFLDVPYCLHPDNRNLTRSRIDSRGRLVWASTGRLPLPEHARRSAASAPRMSSDQFLGMLQYNVRRFDAVLPSSSSERLDA